MKYFIIIRGPLGIGKSTIAKKLATVLKAKYISIDDVLERYNLTRINEDYIVDDFIKANQIVITQIQKEKSIIFDGNFYFSEQIEHLIKNLAIPNFVFTLKAPLETCLKRDKEREKSYGQVAVEAIYNLVSKFDYGTIIETGNKTTDEVVDEIQSHLKNK